MSELIDFYYRSSTGLNNIHARKCVPDGEIKAIVQIVHGIAEHIDRYEEFMKKLADNGYLAVGEDHLGHGKSISNSREQGIFAYENGWQHVLDDLDILRDDMHAQYPQVPYVFFGHSMGSFLTRNYIIDHPDKVDGAIISGTGNQPKAMVIGGYVMAQLLVKKNGADGDGKILNDIAFGSYCDRIENKRTEFDWLSRDNAQVDKYIEDPLCGFVGKISLYRDMMSGIKYITDGKNLVKMNKEMPVYFMSGDCDPVGDYGKGVEKAYKAFCSAGMHDVFMRLYPGGRHEMLNELNKEEVYADILKWLGEKIK